jgi:lactoylglutathione lyase
MIRTSDVEASLRFYQQGLGLVVVRKNDYQVGKFSLIYLATEAGAPEIELTHNWDDRIYSDGDNFGHLAFAVDDIYALCERLQAMGVTILRPPRDGHMAFVKDPSGVSIELLQAGPRKAPAEPWASMQNTGSW